MTTNKDCLIYMRTSSLTNKDGDSKEMKGKGRHDPCVVPRAVPIVESMTALVILDNMLINNSNNI